MRIILILLAIVTNLYPQDGLVKSLYPNGNLESEINYRDKVREGEAKFYYENGTLKEERNYSNGRIEGLVKVYSKSGKLKETFVIEDGRREGPTSLFDENGNYSSDVYYEGGKLSAQSLTVNYFPTPNNLNDKEQTEEKVEVAQTDANVNGSVKNNDDFSLPPEIDEEISEDNQAFLSSVEVIPEPVGGMEAIFKKLIYPSEARKNEVEGLVKIQAFIDEFGEVIDAQVIEGIGSGCDDVARNAVYFAKFKPGMQRGKTVRAMVIIPIKFNPQMNQN